MKSLLLLILLTLSTPVFAENYTGELVLTTTVGEVVLTVEPCAVTNEHGFEYISYATDNGSRHEGCWFKDHDIVNIWFYAENPALVATYKDYYFKPRKGANE